MTSHVCSNTILAKNCLENWSRTVEWFSRHRAWPAAAAAAAIAADDAERKDAWAKYMWAGSDVNPCAQIYWIKHSTGRAQHSGFAWAARWFWCDSVTVLEAKRPSFLFGPQAPPRMSWKPASKVNKGRALLPNSYSLTFFFFNPKIPAQKKQFRFWFLFCFFFFFSYTCGIWKFPMLRVK